MNKQIVVLAALSVFCDLAPAAFALRTPEEVQSVPEDCRQGYKLMEAKQYAPAIEIFTARLAKQPKSYQICDYLGICYTHSDQHEKGMEYFDRALKLRPDASEVYRHRGDALTLVGKFDEAIADMKQAVRLNPGDYASLLLISETYLGIHQYKQAIDYADKAINAGASKSRCYKARAKSNYRLGRMKEAIADYTALMDKSGVNCGLLTERGKAYAAAKMYEKAIADFSTAIARSPKRRLGDIYLERAKVYEKTGKSALAAADRKKAQSIDDFEL